jgi:hypothetical protein
LKSGPLWLECYAADGDEALVGNAGVQKFVVTAYSYVSIIVQQTSSCPRIKFLHYISIVVYNNSGSVVLHVEGVIVKQHKMG